MRYRTVLLSVFISIAALLSADAQPVVTALLGNDSEQVKLQDGTIASVPSTKDLNDLLEKCGTIKEFDRRLRCAGDIYSIAKEAGALKYRRSIQPAIQKINVGFGLFVGEMNAEDAALVDKRMRAFKSDYSDMLSIESAAK